MTHRLGQVFLRDRNMISKIMRCVDLQPQDVVIEIGCGDGSLTAELVKQAAKVIVLELDDEMIQKTRSTVSQDAELVMLHGDVLDVDLESVIRSHASGVNQVKIVANIPYYISAKIVKWVLTYRQWISDAWLMVQDEFARKLAAGPGDSSYTSLTVYTSFYMHCKYQFKVKKTVFNPIPKVDSAIVTLTPRSEDQRVDLGGQESVETFFSIVRAGFWGRRKPLMSALAKNPYRQWPKEQLKTLSFFQATPTVRAERLSVAQFLEVYRQLEGED